jgi:hypothetical protein
VLAPPGASAFAYALESAATHGAGALLIAESELTLDFALVLEPEQPLREASRVFFVCMAATADAIGACAPPERPVTIDWPDTFRFDQARIGGGRLGWPERAAEDEIPDWIVFSATLLRTKRQAGDPGHTPDSTSLEDEHVAPEDHNAIVESFARYLLRGLDLWDERGFAAVSDAYLARLTRDGSGGPEPADAAELLGERAERAGLLSALASASWLDPRTGAPRL